MTKFIIIGLLILLLIVPIAAFVLSAYIVIFDLKQSLKIVFSGLVTVFYKDLKIREFKEEYMKEHNAYEVELTKKEIKNILKENGEFDFYTSFNKRLDYYEMHGIDSDTNNNKISYKKYFVENFLNNTSNSKNVTDSI